MRRLRTFIVCAATGMVLAACGPGPCGNSPCEETAYAKLNPDVQKSLQNALVEAKKSGSGSIRAEVAADGKLHFTPEAAAPAEAAGQRPSPNLVLKSVPGATGEVHIRASEAARRLINPK